MDVSPRDLVFTLPADEAASSSATPRQLAATNLRYGGISWGDDDLALIYESWWKTRRSIVCTFAPARPDEGLKVRAGSSAGSNVAVVVVFRHGTRSAAVQEQSQVGSAGSLDIGVVSGLGSGCPLSSSTLSLSLTDFCLAASQVLFDRNYEDAYTDPGSPAKRRTQQGTYVLAQLDDETESGRRRLLMQARDLDEPSEKAQACRRSAAALYVRAIFTRTAGITRTLHVCEWHE